MRGGRLWEYDLVVCVVGECGDMTLWSVCGGRLWEHDLVECVVGECGVMTLWSVGWRIVGI